MQETPCGAWDSEGGVLLENLTPGVEVKLRGATAQGSPSREMIFLPSPKSGPHRAVFIELQ